MVDDFEPKIVCFACRWCSYAGADMAGTSRLQYPPNARIIRVNCSGRVDPAFILRALKLKADGVLIAGCHYGDCHYLSGNYQTARRIALLKEYLKELKINPDRLRLEWISAAEGTKFAATMKEFVNQIKTLGPNPLVNGGPE
ncbi:MAG: hydrogenase iron-sulfur subunit [Promethearchaeota archaeon]